MLALVNTNEVIEIVTGTTASTDWVVAYVDTSATGHVPNSTQGNSSTAGATTIISSPAAGVTRKVIHISVTNVSTGTQTITVNKDVAATNYRVFPTVTLSPGDSLQFNDINGFKLIGSNGLEKVQATENVGSTSFVSPYIKVGTTAESAGSWYCYAKDSGFPGAWSPGSPGTAGRATSGTVSNDAGCLQYFNATTGNNYLEAFMAAGSTGHYHALIDLIWVNTGLSVTATTEQSITAVDIPARDMLGLTSGLGVQAGLLITTATTQAGAITATLKYTDASGTTGKRATGTIPATAAIGTIVPFNLSATGEIGVRKIESLTLGGTLTAGAISLILYRTLAGCPSVLSNIGNTSWPGGVSPGVRLYNDTCMIPIYLASTTAATTTAGTAVIVER